MKVREDKESDVRSSVPFQDAVPASTALDNRLLSLAQKVSHKGLSEACIAGVHERSQALKECR